MFAPFDMQVIEAGYLFDSPTDRYSPGIDRQSSVFHGVGCEFVHRHGQRRASATADPYLGSADRDAVRTTRLSMGLQRPADELMEECTITVALGQHVLCEGHGRQPSRERIQ
jgi:hypothetical protein